MYIHTSISSAWFRVHCSRRRNLWFVILFLFALFAYELLHPRHGTGKLPFNSHFNYPMSLPLSMSMPTQASSSPARWVAFENLGSNGLMSDNTLWARTVSVCESVCVCVRVCVCFVVRISFLFSFFSGGSLRFSDGKNCVEIYFAAFPSVLAGFTHLLGFWQFALHLVLRSPGSDSHTHTHTHKYPNVPRKFGICLLLFLQHTRLVKWPNWPQVSFNAGPTVSPNNLLVCLTST